jgi:hypothetical protein
MKKRYTLEEAFGFLERECKTILDVCEGNLERTAEWWTKIFGVQPELVEHGDDVGLVVSQEPLWL